MDGNSSTNHYGQTIVFHARIRPEETEPPATLLRTGCGLDENRIQSTEDQSGSSVIIVNQLRITMHLCRYNVQC